MQAAHLTIIVHTGSRKRPPIRPPVSAHSAALGSRFSDTQPLHRLAHFTGLITWPLQRITHLLTQPLHRITLIHTATSQDYSLTHTATSQDYSLTHTATSQDYPLTQRTGLPGGSDSQSKIHTLTQTAILEENGHKSKENYEA